MNRSMPTIITATIAVAVIILAVVYGYSQAAPTGQAARPVVNIVVQPDCAPCVQLEREWDHNPRMRKLIEAGWEVRFLHVTAVPTVVTPDGKLNLFKDSDFTSPGGPLLGLYRILTASRSPPRRPPAPDPRPLTSPR